MLKSIFQQAYHYARLMRLDRPLPIFLLLWPALWGLWIASAGAPPLKLLILFISGVVVMRSAGCIINDFADRHVDGHVERTKLRPLVTGVVNCKKALFLFVGLCLVALLIVIQLNQLTIALAIPAVVLTICYPFAKRYSYLPQVLLGIIFGGWGVLMAFAAQTQRLPSIAWFLFFIASLWPIIYDTFYAMVDRDDDTRIGVKSTAILFNHYDRLITGLLQCVMWVCLMALGYMLSLSEVYFLCISAAGGFFIYQQYLIKDRDRERCLRAFLNNHWVGLIVFVGLVISYSR